MKLKDVMIANLLAQFYKEAQSLSKKIIKNNFEKLCKLFDLL